MKTYVCILAIFFVAQFAFAAEFPPGDEVIKKEFGEKYYDLRIQLQYKNANDLSAYGDLSAKKNKYINILLKLLTDKSIIEDKKGSLFDRLNVNASDLIMDENLYVINFLQYVLLYGNGYSDYTKAMVDNFKKMGPKDRSLMLTIADKSNIYFSIQYQKTDKMPKKCADAFSKYNFSSNEYISIELNDEKLNALKKLIEDNECIRIGILFHYADSILREGDFSNSSNEAQKKVVMLYEKYFNELNDSDLNSYAALRFLQKISFIKEKEGDIGYIIKINKNVVNFISSGRLKLEDKNQLIRQRYIRLLSKTMYAKDKIQIKEKDEIIEELKKVIRKNGNIFILKGEEAPSDLKDQERAFLKLIGD